MSPTLNVCRVCLVEFHSWPEYHEHVSTGHEPDDVFVPVRVDIKAPQKRREYTPMDPQLKRCIVKRVERRLAAFIVAGLMLVVGASGFAHANCGNDNGNGNGCGGTEGPQGPIGPQGPQGVAGQNGTNGQTGSTGIAGMNGTNGKDGKDGKDASYQFRGTDLTADVAVRLLDTKYLQLQAYDTYVFGSEPSQDVFGAGRNMMIGARVVIKLGSSYEERLLEKQAGQIKALEALVSRTR